jgi:hypothetical protein
MKFLFTFYLKYLSMLSKLTKIKLSENIFIVKTKNFAFICLEKNHFFFFMI